MKYFLFVFIAAFSLSCDIQDEAEKSNSKGEIVGYLKCSDNQMSAKTILGLFVITNKNDSLLTFNIPSSVYDLDTTQLEYGINFIDGGTISFCFRNANDNELIHFYCSPSSMQNPSFFPIENFSQVIVDNVNNINEK